MLASMVTDDPRGNPKEKVMTTKATIALPQQRTVDRPPAAELR